MERGNANIVAEQRPQLILLAGPTAVGKTAIGVELAKLIGCEIVSADSRQVYSEMLIGTAAPTEDEMRGVPHHFVRYRSLTSPLNAFDYEQEVLAALPEIFARGNGRAILSGGSMMYLDAVSRGIDEMPTISDEVRTLVKSRLETDGLEALQRWLLELDPAYHAEASARGDIANPRRVVHAIEVCLEGGVPYSELRKGSAKERPFDVVKFALTRVRDELYCRIERRVDQMIADGLESEVRSLMHLRHHTTLDTVGYREMMQYADRTIDLAEAIRLIKRNTRHYAKKQLTWIKSDGGYKEIALSHTTTAESAARQIADALQEIK